VANEEQMEILLQGPSVWNKWREELNDPWWDIDLSGEDLSVANLEGADLSEANLRGADLDCANLRNANLQAARFEGAQLCGANFNGADLEQASGFIFDHCDIRNTKLHSGSTDPWSVLRRKYTGIVMVWTTLALMAAFLPYFLKAFYWSVVNRSQSIIDSQSMCMHTTCDSYTVLQLMLGIDKEPIYWLIPFTLVIYYILRGLLTYRVSALKDEEQRSGYTPTWSGRRFWQGYRALYKMHQLVNIIFYLAVVVFVFNSYHWLSQTVWIPSSP